MKKTFLTLTLFASTFSQAQLFLEGSVGYGLPLASDQISTEQTVTTDFSETTTTYDQISGSYGSGLNAGFNLGYMFNSNLGFGLNTNMLFGRTYTMINNSSMPLFSSRRETTLKGNMIRITPSFILAASGEKFIPYARVGLALGVGGKVEFTMDYTNSDGDAESIEQILDENIAIGVSTELGLQMRLTERLSLLCAFNSYAMNWAPGHATVTKHVENGVDVLPTYTVLDKEVEYVESVTTNTSTPPSGNEPEQLLKMFLPFSSYGLNFGVRFTL